jgi:hypothetical protein
MSALAESSNGVHPLILRLVSRHFPNAEGLVSRTPYGLSSWPGIYAFADGQTVYQITVYEPEDANALYLKVEDLEILAVDIWELGEGRKTSKRLFTQEGERVLEAQRRRMRENVRDLEQAHHIERCILGLMTGRFLSELPPEPVLPTLDELPVIDLEQEPL